jgi:hypothetical protein
MTRRTKSSFKAHDDAFPVRIKVVVPETGFGVGTDAHDAWLRENLTARDWATGPARAAGRHCAAFYFRRIGHAQAFMAAFPLLQLADGTALPDGLSPAFR